jgi:predicted DNA binding protein
MIELIGIAEVDSHGGTGTLPLSRLSARQREVFQLARQRGYYAHPKTATAADLAEELDVTILTIHEHLHGRTEAYRSLVTVPAVAGTPVITRREL